MERRKVNSVFLLTLLVVIRLIRGLEKGLCRKTANFDTCYKFFWFSLDKKGLMNVQDV